jgi:hypothetical protein
MNKDLEQLKILSIFHYVLAGLCIFPMLYGIFYMAMGIFFGVMIANAPNTKDGPPPAIFGGIFILIGLVIFLIALAFGISLFKAGRNLVNHKSYTFCLVIAGISCIFMPFGTVLGIFTIIVLLRDSVKQLFNGTGGSPNYNPQSWQR